MKFSIADCMSVHVAALEPLTVIIIKRQRHGFHKDLQEVVVRGWHVFTVENLGRLSRVRDLQEVVVKGVGASTLSRNSGSIASAMVEGMHSESSAVLTATASLNLTVF